MRFITLKKNNKVNVLLLLLPQLSHLFFISNSFDEYFLPQGAGYLSYATA